jgi:hypothetical protein
MIRQTLALLLDAYRDLNARKLFWVTPILSAVFVGGFACFGADSKGFSVLRWHFDMPRHDAAVIFRSIFGTLVIGIWLTWVATILALISTAGIFPDFITGGSVDLYLSKPLSRARLFIIKYFCGLLFVTLQVALVTVGGFLLMEFRGHLWMPSIFWAIPIVVCFFSYLFAISVFFGVLTRSTIAALLLAILCWTLFAVLDRIEPALLNYQTTFETQARRTLPATADDEARKNLESDKSFASLFRVLHTIAYTVKTVSPKTAGTVDLLDRFMFTEADVDAGVDEQRIRIEASGRPERGFLGAETSVLLSSQKETVHEIWSRSPAWVIGTSLAFEAVIVLWAGWIFCRRDY